MQRILPISELFQSTLPRGERPDNASSLHILQQFQSTLPRGERLLYPQLLPNRPVYFNPRSPVGSDSEGVHFVSFVIEFQSTLPRGERQPVGGPED